LGFLNKLAFIFLFIAVFIYNGCSSNKQPTIKYPQWFSNTPMDTNIFYYGLGEGNSRNNATTNALNEIASKISTSISSTIDTNTIANTDTNNKKTYKKTIQKNIINKVKKIIFNDYQVVKYKKINNSRHIILIKINRIKNAQFMLNKLNNKLNNFASVINNKSKNVIQNLKIYSKIYKDIDNILIPKYFTAQSLLGANTSTKEDIKKMISLKRRIKQYKNSITFNIYSKNKNAKEYINTITAYISNLGYIVANSYNKNNIDVEINFKEKKIKAINNFILKSTINITIKTNNKILNKKTIKIGAKSQTSYSTARAFAIKKLEKKLDLFN